MANTSALGLAFAMAAAPVSSSSVLETLAGEGDFAQVHSRQISEGYSAPDC
jgi:hypothetical protein